MKSHVAVGLTLFLVVGVVFYLAVWGLYEAVGPPPCESFRDSHITGTQVVDGHRVDCFHGQIVKVYP